MSASAPVQTAEPASYEAAMSELETLIGRMESGALSLEDSLAAYQRGSQLLRYCQQTLDRVEQQVRVLESNDADGVAVPLDAPPAGRQGADDADA